MKKIIIKFFDDNPAAIYYLAGLIVLVGSVFATALVGYAWFLVLGTAS